MSVLVVGSVAYDAIETPTAKVAEALGGTAIYFSAAASFFVPVNVVAVVGQDFKFNDIEFLRTRKVDLTGLRTEAGKTFRWKGRYLANMNERKTLYTRLNVFEKFNPVLPPAYQNCKYIFLGNIGPDLQYHVIKQINKPKFVVMDTMNYWISGALPQLKKTIALVNALLINDSEVKQLSGVDNLFTGARIIQEMGPKILVIKKGEHGSMLVHNNRYFFCPGYPIEKLFDPTGAGDSFAGGFVGYLAKTGKTSHVNLRRAVLYATAVASFCVESFSVERLKQVNLKKIQTRVDQLIRWTTINK